MDLSPSYRLKIGLWLAFSTYLIQFPVLLGSILGWFPLPPVVVFPPLVGLINTKIENRGWEGLGLIFPPPLRSSFLVIILTAVKVLGYLHIFTLTGISFSFPPFSTGVMFVCLKEFVIAVFILAMWEEIVNRGYIQTRLQEAWGFLGVLLSALMFASLHLPSAFLEFDCEPQMAFFHFMKMFVPGFMLAFIYWRTHNTLTTIAVHGFRNFLFMIAVSYSGLDAKGLHQLRPGLQILWSVAELLLVVCLVGQLFPGVERKSGDLGLKAAEAQDGSRNREVERI